VRRLPRETAITLLANRPPILGTYLPYFRHPVYAQRALLPPPAATATIDRDWSHWTSRFGVGEVGSTDEEATAVRAAVVVNGRLAGHLGEELCRGHVVGGKGDLGAAVGRDALVLPVDVVDLGERLNGDVDADAVAPEIGDCRGES
jgi:hypothetical protein